MESLLAQWFKFSAAGLRNRESDSSVASVRAIAAGDPDALEDLYHKYSRELFVFVLGRLGDRQLAEETLQDVMLAVWRGARRYRADASVRTWLYSIAHNRVLSAMRKLPEKPVEFDPDLLDSEQAGPADWTEFRRRAARVQSAVRDLPEHQRLVIELMYLHGLTGPEIARVLGVAVGTVKSRSNRALKTLKPLLLELANEP